jgi:hypothetical protein
MDVFQTNHPKCYIPMQLEEIDAFPNSLTSSTMNPKVKTPKEGIGICFLACSTSMVKGACWSSKMGTRMGDKWVNYSHKPNKPNNKLVSA